MKRVIGKTIGIVLGFFGFTYMFLVFTSRWGNIPYLVAGLLLLAASIVMLIVSEKSKDNAFKSNILAILSGVALWGFLGEFLENADMYIAHSTIKIAHWNFLPILIIVVLLFAYVWKKRYLPDNILFFGGSFIGIWILHYIMIFQIDLFSKTAPITYISFALFVLATGFLIWRLVKSDNLNKKMAFSVAVLYTGWSILEYIWLWRLIPGPYSI